MDMFTALIKSFWSVAPYRTAAYQWRWKALFYFLLLSALSATAATFVAAKMMSDFYESSVRPSLEKLENVTVENGILKTPDAKPVELKTADGQVYGIITESYLDANATKGLMFSAEKDRLSFYLPDGSETFVGLDEISSAFPDNSTVSLYKIAEIMSAFFWIFAPAAMFAAALLINGIYAAIMSLAAYILSLSTLPTLGYWRCARIGLMSLTPPVVIDLFAMPIFGAPVPGFVFALISCALVIRAMRTMRADGTAEKNPPDATNSGDK